jgi:ATP-binding cassette subfamily F protein 3
MAGQLRRPGKLRVGYFAQHQEAELDPRETALEHIARALPDAPATMQRSQLARFGLDRDRALTPTGSLSGGERARLLLALATRDAPQLLILDEPTNHLDIDACDALVRALNEFAGAVLLITHDPHLVELVADTLWIVDGGTIAPYEGDMDDYRTLLLKKGKPAKSAGGNSKKEERRARAQARAGG